mgnify:CR=1 FL=1
MPRRGKELAVATAESDTTFLAGWMYADLFLALMVVFLATISFVPAYLTNARQATSTYNYVKVFQEPLIVVYDSFDSKLIQKDINYFFMDFLIILYQIYYYIIILIISGCTYNFIFK